MEQLAAVVDQLEPLQSHWEQSQGSVLLRELANCKNIESAFSNASETPLLHAMSAVHGYVVMLVHVCRTGQNDIRNILIEQWGQNNKYGQKLLYKLVQLYTALVWESTLLLALCTDDIIPVGCDFGKEDLDKLPKEKVVNEQSAMGTTVTASSTVSIFIYLLFFQFIKKNLSFLSILLLIKKINIFACIIIIFVVFYESVKTIDYLN